MPRRKSDFALLDSAETIEDFILLLASGMSADCKDGGDTLVKRYYNSLNLNSSTVPFAQNEWCHLKLKKLKTLLAYGADVSLIFQSFTYDTDFSEMLTLLENQLTLVEVFMENEQAKQWMTNEPSYHESLKRIREQMERTSEKLRKIQI